MNDKNKKTDFSVTLSLSLVILFGVLLALCDIAAPFIVHFVSRELLSGLRSPFAEALLLTLFYAANLPAYLLLYEMFRLLQSIKRGDIFTEENVSRLRLVCVSCFVAALLCLVGLPWWPSLALVTLAASFMGLIVRVVQSIIRKTVSMKHELDFLV